MSGPRLPAGDRRRRWAAEPHRGAMARDLVAARAVRAGRRRGLGQDLGDGRAGRLPGARRARTARRGPTRGRAARQRALPDVHQQGDREPAAADPPRAGRARPRPTARSPRSCNYHGFAAQLLDRHGVLIGIEPNQRVLSPAQRVELCARVLDRMTFEVVEAQTAPRRRGQDPDARRPGGQPLPVARRDRRVQRTAARGAQGASLRSRVPRPRGSASSSRRRARSSAS